MESRRATAHLLVIMLMAVTGLAQEPTSHAPSQQTTRTRVVLLGTGIPVPDPDRSGPATVIVVDDSVYLVDFGPGVVRRAESAALTRKIPAVEPGNLKVAFVTHLHSDHTAGYSDLILTGWTSGRRVPLEVYGPSGLQSMTEHILKAYRIDIETRTNPDGPMRDAGRSPDANPSELKSPETAAREFVEAIGAVLSDHGSQAEHAMKEALYESSQFARSAPGASEVIGC